MSLFDFLDPDVGAGDTAQSTGVPTGVTIGGAVAIGVGGLLLGGVVGWMVRGDHDDKKRLSGGKERRKLREESR